MGQQIEYGNCIDFQNTTVTISFMARAVTATAGSTALIFRTRTIAGVDGACLFAGTNVDSALTLTTSWTRYTVTRTLPATFGSLSLEFALISHVSGDGIMLAQVQIEPGPVATPFEQRPIGAELALCQRYAYAAEADGALNAFMVLGIGRWYGGADAQIVIQHPVPMRSAPSLESNTAVGTFAINTDGTFVTAALTGISLNEAGINVSTISANYSAGGRTTGQATTLYCNNTSLARLVFSAEL
jgi:hypothetical protein